MSGVLTQAKKQALDRFLASVERRAYVMAKMAINSHDEALDIVQDAMTKLVSKYHDKPESEWKPLFYKILQSRIRDWYRREKVKRGFFGWLGSGRAEDEYYGDPLEQYPGHDASDPSMAVDLKRASVKIVEALQTLSVRQQQVFMLRIWEGLDVKQTAYAMGCSEGSVKTHLSRALNALKEKLHDWGDDDE
ncbi:MAG: RNA polymerase sigma factor [Gammaproteobacteria bacterium]|nr:MAG: RNA polymerase sigma factor [Gammaproteobacteria bacterium]